MTKANYQPIVDVMFTKQSKQFSLIEAIANTSTGYVIALIIQYTVFPMFGIHVPVQSHLAIATIFTVTSLIRSYILRRIFNGIRS